MSLAEFSIIVTMDSEGGIAKDRVMPWRNRSIYTFFRDTTIGQGKNVVIMGRTTYEMIPEHRRPLRDRDCVVISRTWRQADHTDANVYPSLLDALAGLGSQARRYDEVFLAGGEMLFREAVRDYMYLCKRIYVTQIKEVSECDLFFPFESIKGFPLAHHVVNCDFHRMTYAPNVRHEEHDYLAMLNHVLENGELREDTRSVFGARIEFNVVPRFPLITTKQLDWEKLLDDMMTVLTRGGTAISTSKDTPLHPSLLGVYARGGKVTHAECEETKEPNAGTNAATPLDSQLESERGDSSSSWEEVSKLANAADGDGGPRQDSEEGGLRGVSHNGRECECECDATSTTPPPLWTLDQDQLGHIVSTLKTAPHSDDHLLAFHIPSVVDNSMNGIPNVRPSMVQFYVSGDQRHLDCQVHLRRCDIFGEMPIDIAFFALLMYITAALTNYSPRKLVLNVGNAYVKNNNISAISRQLKRTPRPFPIFRWTQGINHTNTLEHIKAEYIALERYSCWPFISGV